MAERRSDRDAAGRRETERGDARNGAPAGPARERIIEAEENLRDEVGDEASYQARPKSEYPVRSRERETGTAERAEEAAGLAPDEQHLAASERAYDESRGDERPREKFDRG